MDEVRREEILGLGTIRGLAGSPPLSIPVPHDTLAELQYAMSDLNPVFIAVIPYCYKCREPLIWIRCSDPKQETRLFRCDRCGRVWTKGEGFSLSPEHPPEKREDTRSNLEASGGISVGSEPADLNDV